MRYILAFLVLIVLNLNTPLTAEKDKGLKSNTKIEKIISTEGIEYSYIINWEEMKRVKPLYKEILKKDKPVYRLDKLPLIISDLKSITNTHPFYIISQKIMNDDKSAFKIILFKNVIENFFKEKLLQILQKNIQNDSNIISQTSSNSFYLKLLLHHLSHFSGPSIINNSSGESVSVDEILVNNFNLIEEIRADMSALDITNKLVLKKIITKEEKNNIYKAHIAHILYQNKKGSKEQKSISSIQLKFFKKKGGISYNMLTDKISIDMLELEKTANKLLKKTMNFEIKATESLTKINEFIEKFSGDKVEKTKKNIKIITPNGNENWTLGENQNIKWTTDGISNYVKITLWKGKAKIGTIAKNLNPSTGVYHWKVGDYKKGKVDPGTGYFIKIKEQSFKTNYVSNSTFNIIPK